MENKTILLINEQDFSFPMSLLGEELEKNNNVHYYFINPFDVMGKNPNKSKIDFFLKDKVKNRNVHDVKDISEKFIENKNNIAVDYNRLKEIEKNYTNFSSINKQLLTSQDTSSHFHDRFYSNPMTNEERLYWVILNYDKTESLINLIKPDFIFDLEAALLQRSIINEIAYKKNIKYVTAEHTRYENFIIPTFTLGIKQDQYFIDTYKKNKNQKDLDKYINALSIFRNQDSIITEMNKKYVLSSYQFNFIDLLKIIIRKNYNMFGAILRDFKNSNQSNSAGLLNNVGKFKKLIWHQTCAIRKFYLYSKFNKYFLPPINEQYVYMPLHLIPESTQFTKAPMYINELLLIEAISKTLPISWKLYVKEHPWMMGERDLSFYAKVSKIPNVKLLDFRDHREPKDLIQKSQAVITITGSSAFEAAILNKPAIVFGNVSFNVIPGIKVANNFEEIEQLFKLIENNNWCQDNTRDCAIYLKSIQEVGVNLNLEEIIKLSKKEIRLELLDDNEKNDLKDKINKLKMFYEKAVDICKKEQYNLDDRYGEKF